MSLSTTLVRVHTNGKICNNVSYILKNKSMPFHLSVEWTSGAIKTQKNTAIIRFNDNDISEEIMAVCCQFAGFFCALNDAVILIRQAMKPQYVS